jgi:hypothetical protein
MSSDGLNRSKTSSERSGWKIGRAKLRAGQRLAMDLTMEKMIQTKITRFSAAC